MRARPAAGRAAVAVVTVVLSSCSSGDDAAPGTTLDDSETLRTVAVPPERLSPFCEAINDLNERLDSAAPDADTGQMIVDTYSSIVDEVPAEIRDDFLSVLAGLQADPSGTANDTTTTTGASTLPQSTTATTIEDFEEGYIPDDDAALRLNAYLASACTDTQNNPGPSPTEPPPPPLDSTTVHDVSDTS